MKNFNRISKSINRQSLPLRPTVDVFIFDNKGNVVARDLGDYINFPGGGIDVNETVYECSKRETLEETGIVITNPKIEKVVEFIWDQSWANTKKRKVRFEKYKGERIFLVSSTFKKITKATSIEGDSWDVNNLWMPIHQVIKLMKSKPGNANMRDYRNSQLRLLENKI